VRAPEAFEVVIINLPRRRPSLGTAQDDHRPARPDRSTGPACLILDFANLEYAMFHCRSHRLMHALRIAAFDEVRRVPVSNEQRFQLFMADAGEDGGVIDLVAVEMQDRQHRAVNYWIKELVAVPAGRERAGLGLTVTHHHKRDQVWMVIHRPVGVRDAVTELSAFVDAARGFGSRMTANPSREAELLEEALHPGKIFALIRVDFGVRAFEVRVRHYGRRAVSRARDEDRI
jgi:hypothetical protein